jgi:hypothetical protein
MIEFLPFIGLGIVLALKEFKKLGIWLFFIISIPLGALSIFQGYQIANSILKGGETTASDYWSHFLQWRRDAPQVTIPKHWKALNSKSVVEESFIDENRPFSSALEITDTLATHLLVRIKIGGKHGERDTRLVVSDAEGKFYQTIFIGDFLYEEPRFMEFLIELPKTITWPLKTYVWNGDKTAKTFLSEFAAKLYNI